MAKALSKSKQDCVKYVIESARDYKTNSMDFIQYFLCKENLAIMISAAGLESFIANNEQFNRPEPVLPELHPNYAEVLEADAELAEQLMARFESRTSRYLRDLNTFETVRDRFTAKQAALCKLFHDHFGPSVLAVVSQRMERKQYFEALNELEEHFQRDPLPKKLKLTTYLTTMYFEFCITMPVFTQLLETFAKIYGWLDRAADTSDAQKLLWLTEAVEKGEGDFEFAVSLIKMGHVPYAEAARILATRAEESAARVKHHQTKGDSQKKQHRGEANQAETSKPKGKKGKTTSKGTSKDDRKPSSQPCFQFQKGECKWGDKCRYSHTSEANNASTANGKEGFKEIHAKYVAMEAKMKAELASTKADLQKQADRASKYKNKFTKAEANNALARANRFAFRSEDSSESGAESNHVTSLYNWGDENGSSESDGSESESESDEDSHYVHEAHMAQSNWRSKTEFPSPEPSKISSSALALSAFVRPGAPALPTAVQTAAVQTADRPTVAGLPPKRTEVASSRALDAKVAALLARKRAPLAVEPLATAAAAQSEELDAVDSSDDDNVDAVLDRKVAALLNKKAETPTSAATVIETTAADKEIDDHLESLVAAALAKKKAAAETAISDKVQTPSGKASLEDDLQQDEDGGEWIAADAKSSAKKAAARSKKSTAESSSAPAEAFNVMKTRRSTYLMIDTLSSKRNKPVDVPPPQPQEEANMISSARSDRKKKKKRSSAKTTDEIFDTGATDTMKPSAKGLTDFVPVTDPNERVNFGAIEDFGLPIIGRGVDGIFSKVLVVEGIKRPLLSGTRLMSDGFIQLYYGDRVYVYSKTLELVASGTLLEDRLVHRDIVTEGASFQAMSALIQETAERLKAKKNKTISVQPNLSKELANGHFMPLSQLTEKQFVRGKALNRPKAARELVESEMLVLHNRTMHAGRSKLINMVKNRTAIGTCTTLAQLAARPMGDCIACHLGKFQKFPAPPSFSQEPSAPMLMISSDLKGPFKTRSVAHNKYFQLHADRKTGFLMVDFHKTKASAAEALMALERKYAEPYGLKIRYLQSDSDSIYKDAKLKAYAESTGKILQYTAPYRHEGSIEAHMKDIMGTSCTVLADADLAEQHWETVVEAAVFNHNCLPTAKNPKSCPLTEVTGKIPDISNFVPIGYPASCKIYAEEGPTILGKNGQECVVVGYAPESGAYKVFTKTGRPLIRKDVIVDENFTASKKHNHADFRKVLLELEDEAADVQRRDDFDIAVTTGSARLLQGATERRAAAGEKQRPEPQPPPSSPEPARRRAVSFSGDSPPRVRHSSRPSIRPDRLSFNAEKASQPLPPVPKDMIAALAGKHAYQWLRATNGELSELIDRGVTLPTKDGEITEPPFKSKIVYRVSKNSNPLLEEHFKFKARVVACGYSSIFGVHYDESYSPTMLFKSLLIVLSIAQLEGWEKSNIDIGNAYLEALRTKPLYMWLPTDWTRGRKIKVKLARNLYGLKDAGLLWYVLIDKILQKDGYKRSIFDPCVYFKGESILCLFVDDLAITGRLASEVARLKAVIAAQVKVLKDLGKLSKFVGIEIAEDGDHLVLSQLDTANSYVQQYVKNGASVKHVPIEALHKLDQEDDEPAEEYRPIWEEVGKLRYMADRTRHDLQYVASKLGTKSSKASPKYQAAALDAMVYLKYTKDLSLRLGGKDKVIKLFGYADASFIAGDDSKSQLGYCFFLTRDSGAVCARSIKDKTVSLSSTESELKALTEAIKEAIWMRGLLGELGYPQHGATLLYQDNTSAIRLSEKIGSEGRTRHIVNRINFIRQELQNKTIRLEYIPTEDMVADILTGPRERGVFEYLRTILLEGHWRGGKKRI